MKKLLLLLVIVAALFACNGGEGEQAKPPSEDSVIDVPPTDTLGTDEIYPKDKPRKDKERN